MNPVFKGHDAQNLLDNPIHKEAVQKINEYIEGKALKVDPNNKEATQVIIITKQLAKMYILTLERFIENGKVEEIKIDQLEKKKGIKKFNRGY